MFLYMPVSWIRAVTNEKSKRDIVTCLDCSHTLVHLLLGSS